MAQNKLDGLRSMRIGVDNLVACRLITDDGSVLKYDMTSGDSPAFNIYPLPGVMSINVNTNSSIETAYYDDGAGEVATNVGNVEVTIQKSSLNLQERSFLLGKVIFSESAIAKDQLIDGTQDVSPWLAIGFRTLQGDGSYKYIWLYKVKFSDPADNNETKGETISFQSEELVGRAVMLDTPQTYKVWRKVGSYYANDTLPSVIPSYDSTTEVSDSCNPWKIEWEKDGMDTESATHVKIIDAWFTQVILPSDHFKPNDTTLPFKINVDLTKK